MKFQILTSAWLSLVVLFVVVTPQDAYGRLVGGALAGRHNTDEKVHANIMSDVHDGNYISNGGDVYNNNEHNDIDSQDAQQQHSRRRRLKKLEDCRELDSTGSLKSRINYDGYYYLRIYGTQNSDGFFKYAYMTDQDNHRIKAKRYDGSLTTNGGTTYEEEAMWQIEIKTDSYGDDWYFIKNVQYSNKYIARDDQRLKGMDYETGPTAFRISQHQSYSTGEGMCMKQIVLSMRKKKCKNGNDTIGYLYCEEGRDYSWFHVYKANDDRIDLVNDNKDSDWFELEQVVGYVPAP